MPTRNIGDRFDPFDTHVERFVEIIMAYVRYNYGEPDVVWLATVEAGHLALAIRPSRAGLPPPPVAQPKGRWDYAKFKSVVLTPPRPRPSSRPRQKDWDFDADTRAAGYVESRNLLAWYGIERDDIVGSNQHGDYGKKGYASWPYYSAALLVVIERARSTPHEVHVVPQRADAANHGDLQQDPLVYAVPNPRREVGEGDHGVHRESEGDGAELAHPAHPSGRAASGR